MLKNRNFFKTIKKVFMILCTVSVSIILYNQYGFYVKEKNIQKYLVREIENEKEIQEKIKNELDEKLTNKHIENIAREHLGLIKSDEIIFIDDRL